MPRRAARAGPGRAVIDLVRRPAWRRPSLRLRRPCCLCGRHIRAALHAQFIGTLGLLCMPCLRLSLDGIADAARAAGDPDAAADAYDAARAAEAYAEFAAADPDAAAALESAQITRRPPRHHGPW